MFLFKKIKELQLFLAAECQKRNTIGFVPTMGALHEGHLALVEQAMQSNDCVVCSIFVNPTQFNDARDLEKYPRTPERDIEMLAGVGCHVLFMPTVTEIYPPDQQVKADFNFGQIDKVMEGTFRPGHFTGVAQVVNRLLEIVQPDMLYMGQKDFQQVRVVAEMLRQSRSNVELVMCPTIREADGLAMSSRNVRLTPEQRRQATIIYETLAQAREMASQYYSVRDIRTFALEKLNISGFRPEYFEIVDSNTLLPLERLNGAKTAVACTAVWAGEVRLIDNMILTKT